MSITTTWQLPLTQVLYTKPVTPGKRILSAYQVTGPVALFTIISSELIDPDATPNKHLYKYCQRQN